MVALIRIYDVRRGQVINVFSFRTFGFVYFSVMRLPPPSLLLNVQMMTRQIFTARTLAISTTIMNKIEVTRVSVMFE